MAFRVSLLDMEKSRSTEYNYYFINELIFKRGPGWLNELGSWIT